MARFMMNAAVRVAVPEDTDEAHWVGQQGLEITSVRPRSIGSIGLGAKLFLLQP
jgi:hypothetical protein